MGSLMIRAPCGPPGAPTKKVLAPFTRTTQRSSGENAIARLAGNPCGGSMVRPVRVITVPSSVPTSAPSLLVKRWR
jgi:hypothetical protein